MSSVFTLLFAPTFILSLHYFSFETVVICYLLLIIIYSFVLYFKTRKSRDILVPGIYILLLLLAYTYAELTIIKWIPVLVSAIFFSIFLEAVFHKKKWILSLTQRFYPKPLSSSEIDFLEEGDVYWMYVTLFNTIIQVIFVFYASDMLWAVYSSVGWYIFFASALILQVAYGKLFKIKLSTK
jgi:hypothetical protein